MRKRTLSLIGLTAGLAMAAFGAVGARAQEAQTPEFLSGEASLDAQTLQYRLYVPSQEGGDYPLVLFLHGEDAAGTDNEAQLTADVGASFWADDIRQEANPSYVLAPQIDSDDWTTGDTTQLIQQAIDDVKSEYSVDEDRVYIVGLSSGATEAYKLLLEYPDEFAAAIPCAGEIPAEYYEDTEKFEALQNMPLWIFHAADDEVVSVEETNKAIAALQAVGNNAIIYDEFSPGSVSPAHEVWYDAFIKVGTSYNWLFEQSRERTQDGTVDPSMTFSSRAFNDTLTRVNDFYLGNIWVLDAGDEAILVDTGMGGYGNADLYAYVRDNVLKNPDARISVALTHNHGDHILGIPSILASGKLDKVYVGEKDRDGLLSTLSASADELADKIVTVKEGDTITAGDVTLEVIDTPAHTQGALSFIWDGQDAVFTGDSIGSGYLWMFDYVDKVIPSAQHLVDVMNDRGLNNIYTGHFENYSTFTIQYAKDIEACAQGIVDKTIPYGIYTRRVGAVATVGSGSIFFDLDMISSPEETAASAEADGPAPAFTKTGDTYEYGHFTVEALALNANSEDINPNEQFSVYQIMDYTQEVPMADSMSTNGVTDDNNTSSTYVITSGEDALVIDLGNGAAATAGHFGEDAEDQAVLDELNTEFHDLVTALADGRDIQIAITHNHGDHTGYAPAFAGEDVTVHIAENDVNDSINELFADYNLDAFTPGEDFKIQVGDITVDTIPCYGHTLGSTLYVIETPVVTYNFDGTKAQGTYQVFTGDAIGSGSSVWLFSADSLNLFNDSIDAAEEALAGYTDYNTGLEEGVATDAKIRIYGGHGWQYENRFGTMNMDLEYVKSMQNLIHNLKNPDNWAYDGVDGKPLETWMQEGKVTLKFSAQTWAKLYTAYFGNTLTSSAAITGPFEAMQEYAGLITPETEAE